MQGFRRSIDPIKDQRVHVPGLAACHDLLLCCDDWLFLTPIHEASAVVKRAVSLDLLSRVRAFKEVLFLLFFAPDQIGYKAEFITAGQILQIFCRSRLMQVSASEFDQIINRVPCGVANRWKLFFVLLINLLAHEFPPSDWQAIFTRCNLLIEVDEAFGRMLFNTHGTTIYPLLALLHGHESSCIPTCERQHLWRVDSEFLDVVTEAVSHRLKSNNLLVLEDLFFIGLTPDLVNDGIERDWVINSWLYLHVSHNISASNI